MVNKLTLLSVLEPLIYTKDYKHLAEMSRELKIPHPTLRNYLADFEKEGLVIKKINGRMTFYTINYSNPLIEDYILLIEKAKMLKRCKDDLVMKEIAEFFHKEFSEKCVVIFGSFSLSKKANDIDI